MRYPVARFLVLFVTVLVATASPAFAGWEKINGILSQVSVGKNAWGVAPDDTIWYWSGTGWVKIDGLVRNIANGTDGTLWGANAANDVYARVGDHWVQMPGKVTQISVGNASNIWAIGLADDVYKWNSSIANWERVEGSLMWIAVGSDGTVWGVQRGGNVFRRDGGSWTLIPGNLANISVGNASNVWGVNSGTEIYRWDGGKFVRLVGGLKQVSIAANGAAFGVTTNGEVYYAAPGSVPDNPVGPPYVAVGSGKSYLGVNQYIRTGEYLQATNKGFFATVQSDGNFCVYRGFDPAFNFGGVWCSNKVAGGGQFFAVQQMDGNFCVYAGTGPSDNRGGVWCTQATSSGGTFFTIAQDDGNFVTYKGSHPGNNLGLLWHTGVTANPMAAIPLDRAFAIRCPLSHFTGFAGEYLPHEITHYHFFLEGKKGTGDRYVPYPDMTIRLASDPSMCFQTASTVSTVPGYSSVAPRQCQSPPPPTQQWQFDRYSSAAQQIKQGDQCLLVAVGDLQCEQCVVVGNCASQGNAFGEKAETQWLFTK